MTFNSSARSKKKRDPQTTPRGCEDVCFSGTTPAFLRTRISNVLVACAFWRNDHSLLEICARKCSLVSNNFHFGKMRENELLHSRHTCAYGAQGKLAREIQRSFSAMIRTLLSSVVNGYPLPPFVSFASPYETRLDVPVSIVVCAFSPVWFGDERTCLGQSQKRRD